MDYFASRAATGFAIPEWLPTPDNLQYNEAVSQLDEVVYCIIAQRKAQLAKAGASESRKVSSSMKAWSFSSHPSTY